MEWVAGQNVILDFLKKYRWAILVLLAGIVLMVLPEGEKTEESVATVNQEYSLQDSLEEVLRDICGVGKVSVLLTQAAGEETIFQTDDNISAHGEENNRRRETVLISGSGRDEAGLVRQIKAPTYQGAVIVCQGADSASVRLAVVEAVRSATGLTTDRISVLKMK